MDTFEDLPTFKYPTRIAFGPFDRFTYGNYNEQHFADSTYFWGNPQEPKTLSYAYYIYPSPNCTEFRSVFSNKYLANNWDYIIRPTHRELIKRSLRSVSLESKRYIRKFVIDPDESETLIDDFELAAKRILE